MPVTLRITSGRRWNRFETGIVTPTNEHAVLTRDLIGDTDPSRAFRFLTAAADLTLTVDANSILNGGLDSWPAGLPASWGIIVVGAGSVVVAEATIKAAGANSARLTTGNVGGAGATVQQSITVRSGQKRRLEFQLRGDGTNYAKVRILNVDTFKYLNPDGTWTIGAPDYTIRRNAATFDLVGISYEVESFEACGQKDEVTLQVSAYNNTQNTTVYADEGYDFPAFDCASLHGVTNVHGGIAVQLRSSTDAFAASDTLEGTFASPLVTPAAYLLLGGPIYRRYSRIKFAGTPNAIPEIGEATTTQMSTPLRQYRSRQGGSAYRNIMSSTLGGKLRGHKSQKFKVRSRTFRYDFTSQAEHNNARELFHDRPEGQLLPALIIPDTALPDVMLAQLASTWSYADDDGAVDLTWDVVVELLEMPFAPTAA